MQALRQIVAQQRNYPAPAPELATPECRLCGAFSAPLVVRMHLSAGEEVYRQGDRAGLVYRVLHGVVVSYRLLSDGRRQVTEFHLPGDFIGLEAGTEYRTTTEALGVVTVAAMRRTLLAELAASDTVLSSCLWQMSVRAFQRSEDHALILARQGAAERVVSFLLNYADRVGSADEIDLPMTRQDMADHLGLTIHTVSRTLSQLQDDGLIEARSSRHIRLLRRCHLERIRG